MIKIVNGKRYVKWGRLMTVAVWAFVFCFAHILTWFKPDNMAAYVQFLQIFFLGSSPLPIGIVLTSVVRSVAKKPTQYERDEASAKADLDKEFPGAKE